MSNPTGSRYSETVHLPWGKATAYVRSASDATSGIDTFFATYAFDVPPRRVDPKLLHKAPAALLTHRACVSQEASLYEQTDATKHPWPAVVFAGVCKGGDHYRWIVLVANHRVFSFQAVSLRPVSANQLQQALDTLLAGFRATREP